MRDVLLLMACATCLGCAAQGRALELPEWPGVVALEEEAALPWMDTREGAAAARVLSSFRDAIRHQRFDEALEALSFETRLFLDHHHPEGGEAALAEGRLHAADGVWSFDPIEVFAGPVHPEHMLLADLASEEGPALGPRRVVLQSDQGEERWTVIRERDHWRIHRPRIAIGRMEMVPSN